ncbi:endonuclease [miscellaneous Crenarchaeota group-1 archaeon SG8-32-1]|uniref:Probable endonuclease 4 n=1 Tax=miscellaneous Crenarchaeota group-1 archaeon SG8-32-1 TaxID=1685124 RepID=A0A0M0BRS0_9ARCH|nr:MAG: endonuclease [miscellaneous Crenarchaeota group-1 archaeon SG8-32-1]
MRIGFHISIHGSIALAVDRAEELGCSTFQIFTRSPRQWHSSEITLDVAKAFTDKMMTRDIRPVFAHMPYLPNLASPRDDVYKNSVNTLISELERCKLLNIPYLVTHLGSHLGSGIKKGVVRLTDGINQALTITEGGVTLLLENTAGTRNSMGSTFEDINHIIENVTHPKMIGICFDTSHAFAAGYDLRTEENIESTVQKIDDLMGFEKLKVVHLNDSKGDFNSRIDRHEHIGLGKIGEEGFRNILASKLGTVPLIMETPKDSRRDDVGNLEKVKELAVGI